MADASGAGSPGSSSKVRNARDLREFLRRVEAGIADLRRGSAEQAVDVVRSMHLVQEGLPRLEKELGVEFKQERIRLAALENALRNNAPELVKKAGAGRLRALRQELSPGQDDWWMHLDTAVSAGRSQKARQLAIRVGAALIAIVVLGAIYQIFLNPSRGSGAVDDRLRQAEQYLDQGQLEKAVSEYTAALDAGADGPEAPLGIGAALTQLGSTDEAEAYLKQARELSASEADYYAELSLLYYAMASQGGLDATDKAEEAALAAVAADANSANAYLALGSVYELQNRVTDAVAALEKAASLTDDSALTAAIAIRRAMMSQKTGDLPTVVIEESPTAE